MATQFARVIAALLMTGLLVSCAVQQSAAPGRTIVLVTPDEYAAAMEGFSSPQAAVDSSRTRQAAGDPTGPIVELVAPVLDGSAVASPVSVDVRWSAQGGAAIDPDTVRLLYATGVVVKDKTSLLKYCKSALTQEAAGCKLSKEGFSGKVEVPAGLHRVILEVADSKGRKTVREVVLTVTGPNATT